MNTCHTSFSYRERERSQAFLRVTVCVSVLVVDYEVIAYVYDLCEVQVLREVDCFRVLVSHVVVSPDSIYLLSLPWCRVQPTASAAS